MEMQPFFNVDNVVDGCESEGLHEDNEYDAINDETFGGEINDFNEQDDLEEFSNRTARLILDEPSCSVLSSVHKNVLRETNYNGEFLNACTLEDIEREQLNKIRQNNYIDYVKCGIPNLQTTTVPLSVEELERQMLQETSIQQASCEQQTSNIPPSRILQHFSPQLPNVCHSVNISPFNTVSQCFSRPPPIIFPRENFIPHYHRFDKKGGQHGNRSVPGAWNAVDQTHLYSMQKNQRFINKNVSNDSSVQHDYRREKNFVSSQNNNRHNRPKGLPSNKTISDFAFDPYAGFMSKKEREWLIKIHLIQCMGTGDSLDDDFYYSMWKKRNVLKKDPGACKIKIRPRYYSFDDTYPSATYIPPSFSGTLGKPTHCSAKIPRQVIDLTIENIDEEDLDNSGNKNLQKKLKAMLMRIENAALVLSECDNLKRKLASDQIVNEESQQFLKEKVQMILLSVCTAEVLPTVMLIQKGRNLLFQIMDFCLAEEDMFNILKIMIETLPKYAKRIPDNSVIDCAKHFYLFTSLLSNQKIIEIVNVLNFDLQLVGVSKVLFSTVLTLLICLTKRKVSTIEILNSSMMLWLKSQCNELVIVAFKNFLVVEELFVLEELLFLKHWLLSELVNEGNVAEQLANSIENLISNGNHSLNVC